MNLIKFSRRDPNGSDPFIDAARIVSWQAIERGSRITLDTGDSVLVGDAPNAVLGLLNQARKEATMPAELAWTREIPTVDADYLVRHKVGERGAYGYRAIRVAGDTFRLYSESLPGLEGVVRSLSDLNEDLEFLGPLPE